MPENTIGCPQQARPEQALPVHLRRDTRPQSRQNKQLCRDHRTSLRWSQAAREPSAAPMMQPLLQPSAHFPHKMIQDPRGLPPWEVFQRGSLSCEGEAFRRYPHQKTFTLSGLRKGVKCCAAVSKDRSFATSCRVATGGSGDCLRMQNVANRLKGTSKNCRCAANWV